MMSTGVAAADWLARAYWSEGLGLAKDLRASALQTHEE